MSKSPNQKLKLLYLMEILLQQTDERHPMTVPEMIAQLAQRGVSAERKSIYDDMEALRTLGMLAHAHLKRRSSNCSWTASSHPSLSRTKRRWRSLKRSKVLPASMMHSSCSGRSMFMAASRA